MSSEIELAGTTTPGNGAVQPWEQPGPSNLPRAAAALVEWARAASAAHALAESLCKTNFVPTVFRGKPDEATACILAGAEVGLSPMASLQGFDMISGSAYPKAMTLRAVLLSGGHEFIIDSASSTTVKARARRKGSTEWQHVEWTIQRARQLGLVGKSVPAKDPWVKQPQNMLIARATSELSRLVAADSILGIAYSAEEMRDSLGGPVAAVSSPRQRVSVANSANGDSDPTGVDPAEQPQVQPDAPPFDQPPEPLRMISQAQQRLLHKLANDAGLDRDSLLNYASELIERRIDSSKELTQNEAGQVINWLQERALRQQRATDDAPPLDEPPPE